MKLFLCGGGCGKQIFNAYQKFKKVIDKSKPILYIPLAMEEEMYNSCYEWFSNEILNFGLTEFEMVKSSLELSKKDFTKYSALFIGGGNTYKLLKDLYDNSNYNKIIDYLKNGGIVFGGSAGAIIFGKDIDSCLLEDKNNINLKDTKGFNCLNEYSILCHLNKSKFKKNKDYLRKYSKSHKTIYLPEEDIIYISNDKIKLIGNKKYIIFKAGNCSLHNFANFKKDMYDK